MKEWALSKGVTHYTHWFQPLTGATAEKHDAFFETFFDGSEPMEVFNGNALVQQEPDASSFPNGGIRNTFEARGYSAWDPTSCAFVYGTTLCIPTIFVAYTGEALDYKTPLLRALTAVDEAATEVAKFFDAKVSKVSSALGWEQEYFLIDSALAAARPDILQTGRSLCGSMSAKGQQLEDHYFGSIPTRVLKYMQDLENECMLLGIPVKTRHNEVAPNQFELAPIFEETNLAVDHNSLLMDIMQKIAEKHHFKVLFHEKPFKGINGSGKHNNWSLATDTGVNLLSPGKTPGRNLQFLTFFINTIKAVANHEELLRASIASASNDYRLGGNEAPPAIISIFIGSQLSKILEKLEHISHGKLTEEEQTDLKLNIVGKIPDVFLDNTDRNRTSPFAFTGNKFEFRAVGSRANCANAMTVLNTIVADQLATFKQEVDEKIANGSNQDEAIFHTLQDYIKEAKHIIFEGDGYSQNWEQEATKRGLSNHKNTPSALKARITQKSLDLFSKMQVMNPTEIQIRYEVELEAYIKEIQIESRVLENLTQNHILPISFAYQNVLLKNISEYKNIFGEKYMDHTEETLKLLEKISNHTKQLSQKIQTLQETRQKAEQQANLEQKAEYFCHEIKPYFESIRSDIDELEKLIDDQLWTLPKYRELLFVR